MKTISAPNGVTTMIDAMHNAVSAATANPVAAYGLAIAALMALSWLASEYT